MDYPPVSVVMPVRNEERHLAEAVRHVLGQEYPAPVEVVLAVGPSRDRTLAIAQPLAAEDSRVTVVPNPSGRIPAAVNAAIKASRYPIIARVDGHALVPAGYLQQAVRTLQETGADNVGGPARTRTHGTRDSAPASRWLRCPSATRSPNRPVCRSPTESPSLPPRPPV